MKILPIISNQLFNNYNVYQNKMVSNRSVSVSIQPIQFDTVSFTASKASGTPLKRLAEYGIPDMYTGKMMMSYGTLSRLLKNNVFDFNLNKLLPILGKYENSMQDVEHELYGMLKKIAKSKPHLKLDEALKQLYPDHLQKLITVQRSILYDIILKASELLKEGKMSQDSFNDLMFLMRYSNQKLEKDKTTAHFSEKEFIYRLQQIAKQIKIKKRHTEVSAINRIIREAKVLFAPQMQEKKKFGRGFEAKKLKMEYQMQPEILTKNTQSMKHLRSVLALTPLKNNKDILNIFNITDAKVCGSPTAEPFKRQEFIYDLKNIIKTIRDKKMEAEIIARAHDLPTSSENVSAFIVKHVNDTPEKIGYYMFKGSLCSIEHIEPRVPQVREEITVKSKKKKKNGKSGKSNIASRNHINNYGLSSAYVNSLRSNMPFDKWIRINPKAYKACQMYVNRLIELYNSNKFGKVGLDRNYIFTFTEKVKRLSPKEKPIVLDLSKLKD